MHENQRAHQGNRAPETGFVLYGGAMGGGKSYLLPETRLTTVDGRPFVIGGAVTFRGDLDAISAYINAGCPEPNEDIGPHQPNGETA